jgi:hypothetical protein
MLGQLRMFEYVFLLATLSMRELVSGTSSQTCHFAHLGPHTRWALQQQLGLCVCFNGIGLLVVNTTIAAAPSGFVAFC